VILKSIANKLLPTEIIGRKKWGFKVPVAEWFRGPLRPLLRDMLLSSEAEGRGQYRAGAVAKLIDDHASGRANHDKKLWILLQLELWQRMFVDATLKPSDILA
jgi:asparagine synthase (glutamine-hydrolysing)